MHIVFLTSQYYPAPTPNGLFTKQYCDLLKEGNRLTVICMQTGNNVLNGEIVDGIKVYSVTSFGNKLQQKIDASVQRTESRSYHLFHKVVQLLYKPIRGFRSLFFYPSGLHWHVKKAYSCMERINECDPVDCVCAVSAPFSSFIAGMKWKNYHEKVRFITFSLDTYTTGLVRNRNWLVRLMWESGSTRLERQIFAKANFNFITIGIRNDTDSIQCYPPKKTQILPNLISFPENMIENEKGPAKLIFMYCGGFYKKIRNPKYMLDTLLSTNNLDFQLDLYINSACQEIVDNAIDNSHGKFIRHSYLPPDRIKEEMCKADFLIDIGNDLVGATPSKTFDYITTGRPIILFAPKAYRSEALERYPLSLIITQSAQSASEAADIINAFCLKNRGKRLRREEIEALYPEHMRDAIARQIRNAVYQE